jgi:hypothetical protein
MTALMSCAMLSTALLLLGSVVVSSSYILWMAPLGGGCLGRKLVGGIKVSTVFVFSLTTILTSGMHQSFGFALLSYHLHNIASLVTDIFCHFASYMLTSLSSNMVMYLAFAIFWMLRRKFLVMVGTIWISFSGWQMLCCTSLMVSAVLLVPSGSWNTLSDTLPVGMNKALSFSTLMFDVAALSATMDGTEPLRTPFLMFILDILLMCLFLDGFCSSTRQPDGVVSANR